MSESKPDGNTVQANYDEVAGLRNRLVQEQDTTGRGGTTGRREEGGDGGDGNGNGMAD